MAPSTPKTHGNFKLKPNYKCKLCRLKFRHITSIREHISNFHGIHFTEVEQYVEKP